MQRGAGFGPFGSMVWAIVLMVAWGCSSGSEGSSVTGCRTDKDCNAPRICGAQGRCEDPGSGGQAGKAQAGQGGSAGHPSGGSTQSAGGQAGQPTAGGKAGSGGQPSAGAAGSGASGSGASGAAGASGTTQEGPDSDGASIDTPGEVYIKPGGDTGTCLISTLVQDVPFLCQKLSTIADWSGAMCCGPTSLLMGHSFLSGSGAPSEDDLKAIADWMEDNLGGGWKKNGYKCTGTTNSQMEKVARDYLGLEAQAITAEWCSLLDYLNDDHIVIFHGDTQGSNNSNVFLAGKSHWLILTGVEGDTAYINDPGRSSSSQGKGKAYTTQSVRARYESKERGKQAIILRKPKAQPTCTDGVQNQGEEQIDCGGPCKACPVGPQCGDGKKDASEACDGNDFGGKSCLTEGFDAGQLACAACALSAAGCCHDACPSVGVGVCENNEAKTCQQGPKGCLVWSSALACSNGCEGSACKQVACGDGKKDASEACDGNDFGGKSCLTEGFDGGQLACSSCSLSTSSCCSNSCSPGAASCQGSSVVACQQGAGGCFAPVVVQSCGPGCECASGACVCGPKVSGVSPLSAQLESPTLFTLTGTNLPASTAWFLPNCVSSSGDQGTQGSSSQRTFSCTPSFGATGPQQGVIKDQPGGQTLFTFTVNVTGCSPKVTSVSPLTATLNQSKVFTINGQCLPSSTVWFLPDCVSSSGDQSTQGSSSQRTFSCTPSFTAGTKSGLVKDKAGGATLFTFSVSVK